MLRQIHKTNPNPLSSRAFHKLQVNLEVLVKLVNSDLKGAEVGLQTLQTCKTAILNWVHSLSCRNRNDLNEEILYHGKEFAAGPVHTPRRQNSSFIQRSVSSECFPAGLCFLKTKAGKVCFFQNNWKVRVSDVVEYIKMGRGSLLHYISGSKRAGFK